MSANSPFNHSGQASILHLHMPSLIRLSVFLKYKCDPNCAQLNERMDLTSSYLKSLSTSSCPVTGGWRRARTGARLLLLRCPGSRMWRRQRVRPWQARRCAAWGGPASAAPLDMARAAAARPGPGLRARLEMAGERHRRGTLAVGRGESRVTGQGAEGEERMMFFSGIKI